jgi:hypothetical protein
MSVEHVKYNLTLAIFPGRIKSLLFVLLLLLALLVPLLRLCDLDVWCVGRHRGRCAEGREVVRQI